MFGLALSVRLRQHSWPYHTEVPSKSTLATRHFTTPDRPVRQLRRLPPAKIERKKKVLYQSLFHEAHHSPQNKCICASSSTYACICKGGVRPTELGHSEKFSFSAWRSGRHQKWLCVGQEPLVLSEPTSNSQPLQSFTSGWKQIPFPLSEVSFKWRWESKPANLTGNFGVG